ncbi:MAG: sugar nucleotide-binding protein [Pseudomonadota bacterium]|nr:sugar nucleotide-binding protein [Pseudomonadota bacterium]
MSLPEHPTVIELWGGLECTVNRVRDTWVDQLELSGHRGRRTDLDLIAALGIRTVRYPVLWETTAPGPAQPHWEWAEERLTILRTLGITPIVGLVHHGSGPPHTNLLDEGFAPGLAEFAAQVAERFPWVTHYTPVNEPLTTARFSALYGHWYPHRRDDRSFARAFFNQCRAIALSMRAIRRVNPQAQLVQTEDLGTTYGTAHMGYQCDFDNARRWLTWDLLCGRIDGRHTLMPFLLGCGISLDELEDFRLDPCPPQIIGINHYVTSDRYLDERVHRYPPERRGRNGREAYADVEAVRIVPSGQYAGWNVLQDAWHRYGIPIAITEAHLACTREEQLRWFFGAWDAAAQAAASGCDIRAVTAWSLLGAFNWDTLLTRTDGMYESGAFDLRAPRPRPTALATAYRALSAGTTARHPAAQCPGWWHRPDGAARGPVTGPRTARRAPGQPTRPILICGAEGSLGRALVHACAERHLHARATRRDELDICNAAEVERMLEDIAPWAVVNAAGFVRVDLAETQSAQCYLQNVTGPQILARAANSRGIAFLTFSSDLVFDGAACRPYVESSHTAPLNVYGRSKEAAERAVLVYERTLCVRTAGFFGAWGRGDFLTDALTALARGQSAAALEDVVVSPTYLPDLADASLDLLIDDCTGIIHLANRGAVSWAEFAMQGAQALQLDARRLLPVALRDCEWPAARPRFSALASERAWTMPTLGNALMRYARVASALVFRNEDLVGGSRAQ